MLPRIYQRLAPGRAYWRTAPFAEIAQLYASRFLRNIAQNLIGAFVTVFLYQQGYTLQVILLIVAAYYASRMLMSYLSAYIVAWIGPKRSMLISNVVAVPALIALTTIEHYTIWAVCGYFLFESIAMSLLAIASDCHFSSIKNDHRAGRELGWFYIVEKIGAGLAPFAGGLLAYQLGPEAVMSVAAVLMLASALPLFGTPERVRRRQHIIFRGMPWRRLWRHHVVHFGAGADQTISATVWSLFIAIAILGIEGNRVYAELGAFFSISFIVSLIISHIYGNLIDKRKSKGLYRFGLGLDALVHLIRPAVATPLGIGLTNALNETATSAYVMPYVRDQYDLADNLPGYRVVFFSVGMLFFCGGAAIMALIAAGLVHLLGEVQGLRASFIVMAILCMLMLNHDFFSLRGKA